MLSLVIMAGRLTGFGREIVIASSFGLSTETDLAVVLLTAPDLLVNLLLAGGISAALVPEFARLDQRQGSALFLRVTAIVGLVFGLLAFFVALAPQALLLFLAPAYATQSGDNWQPAFALAALAIPLAGLTGVSAALLNARDRFAVAGAGTLIFNAVIISMMLAFVWTSDKLLILALAISLAALARYASQVVTLRTDIVPGLAIPDVDIKGLLRRFGATLTASTIILTFPVIVRSLISLSGDGILAAFNFATKLVELPSGIVLTAISTVAFTALSRKLAANQVEDAWTLYWRRLGLVMGLAVAIMLPAILFAQPIAATLFGYGEMTPEDVRVIGELTRISMFSLPAIAAYSMAMAMLNARRAAGTLFRRTLAGLVVLFVLLVPGVYSSQPELVVAALPVATSILAVFLVGATWKKDNEAVRTLATFLSLGAMISLVITAAAYAILTMLHISNDFIQVVAAGLAMVLSMASVSYLWREKGN